MIRVQTINMLSAQTLFGCIKELIQAKTCQMAVFFLYIAFILPIKNS
jgi:hypothetical protein